MEWVVESYCESVRGTKVDMVEDEAITMLAESRLELWRG
jgi:hypothetical protein